MDRIRPLQTAHVPETATLIARAMEVDPAYRYLLPDANERSRGLERLFAGNLALHVAHGCTHVGLDGERVVATVTLRPLAGLAISPWTMLRHGLLPFLWAHGTTAVRRMLWLKQRYDALEAELAEGPHFHVHMMAVLPERQGQGLGGRLLQQVLDAVSADRTGHSTVLTTHLPRNVAFYRRAGFDVRFEREVSPPGGRPYPVWGMALATHHSAPLRSRKLHRQQ